jgi:GMP synthase-like glutamine amidotransferase
MGVEEVRIDRGEPLPGPADLGDMGGLVVMGGPMGVGDDDAPGWMAAERDLLSAAVAGGLPVLGICLGAQQLAASLGAAVTRGATPEIGPGEVVLTRDGRLDPVFGPEYTGLGSPTVPCVHWHGDTFALPEGATHLAATRAYPHQAFRVGHHAYGLQFHVEVDEVPARAWAPHLPDGVRLDGPHLTRIETVGRRLLARFVAVASAPVPLAADR